MSGLRACERCLARSWLLVRLAPNIELVRGRLAELLALPEQQLIEAVGGGQQDAIERELRDLDHPALRRRCERMRIEATCGCGGEYPERLRGLPAPPAVLYVAGGVERLLDALAEEPVAIVGARRASGYGLDVARALGRGLGAAGLTVISGMALGIDSAAHGGALEAGAPTIAVLPSGFAPPYPRANRRLYSRIVALGAAVSELPPVGGVWRWMFPARNRIVAALSAMTVLVEARHGSGSLNTIAAARELGRPIGAVPGRVTSALAAGPNELLARGETVVRDPADVLDRLFGAGERRPAPDPRPELSPELAALLEAVSEGHDTAAALAARGFDADEGLALLASLELGGYLRRGAGGRYSVLP